jgi:mannose/fructose/sorbose-specific phosphotransferase system IIA component
MVDSVTNHLISEVPGLLIVTHGRFGEELIESARMIAGDINQIAALSLEAGQEPSDYQRQIDQVLEKFPKGSVILADILGGTPCNSSAASSEKYSIGIVSGVNLPMVLEALYLREKMSGRQLAEALVRAGKDGVRDVLKVIDGV